MKEESSNFQTILVNLNERTKELNCLYEVDEILKNYSSTIDDVLIEICKIIPKGWQHTEICRALIVIDNKEYFSDEFKKTELKQKSTFSFGDKYGEVRVYYIKPVRQERKTIFLNEEQKLLNTISHKLQMHLEYRYMKDMINRFSAMEYKKDKSSVNQGDADFLKSIHLTPDQISEFTKVCLHFKKGETLCKQGALTNHIFFQSKGLSKAYLEGAGECSFIFKIIKPHDFIGLSSLYGENTYQFTLSALQSTTVYLIEKELFQKIFFENRPFAEYILKWYSLNYEKLLSKISDVSSKQSLGRIADVLIYLSNFVFESPIIEGCISRRDIAEMAGLSTESVVRILSDLKNENIIRTNKSEIEILNVKALHNLSIAG